MPRIPPVFGEDTEFETSAFRGPLIPLLTSNQQNINVEFDSGVDLAEEVKTRTLEYLKGVSRNNQYPINDSQRTVTIEFSENGSQDAVNSFNRASNSGLLDGERPLNVDKNDTGDAALKNAINIFGDVQQNKDDSDIAKRLRQTLEGNNLNTPSNPFISTTTANLSDEDRLLLGSTLFSQPGVYVPRKFPDNSGSPAPGSSISIEDVKKLGSVVTTEAQGPFANINYRQPKSEIDLTAPTSLLGQGSVALGGKVNTGRFLGKALVRSIKPETSSTNTATVFEPSVESYGSDNNEYNTATGVSASSTASMAALVLVVGGALYALARRLRPQAVAIVSSDKSDRSNFYGSYSGNANTNQTLNQTIGNSGRKLFDWPETSHDFGSCLTAGLETFFEDSGALSTTAKLAGSSLYFRTVLKSILRSLVDLGVDIANSGQNILANPLAGLAQFDPLEIYDRLNANKAVRFIGAMVGLGDRVLYAKAENPDNVPGFSVIDSILEEITLEAVGRGDGREETTINPAVLVSKSRLRDGRLAYGTNTVRSLLLEPVTLRKANEAIGNANAYNTLVSKLNNTGKTVGVGTSFGVAPGRISADTVRRTENYLDAQYVPFYFHDLRTNEIVAFHAFLETFSDQLSVEFNDTSGRIGGLKTYKDTKRTMSFAFKILATNESDFESMWYKINRLGAMCYTQWTEGRRISVGDSTRFIQPFSQMPGASPLIRLRVGDIVKGNYSKLNASRLFGSGDEYTNLSSVEPDATSFGNDNRRAIAGDELRRRYAAGNFQTGDEIVIRAPAANAPYRRAGETQTTSVGLSHHAEMRARVVTVRQGELVVDGVRTNDRAPQPISVTTSARQQRGRRNRANVTTPLTSETISETTQFIVPLSAVVPRGSSVEQIINARAAQLVPAISPTSNQQADATSDSRREFLDDSSNAKNPIMKAFASAQGKGLAGFITNFELSNVLEATWVTDRLGDRAPMYVTVGFGFAPIHDIQPGLDHNGVMTAPIWPVGGTIGTLMDSNDSAEAVFQTSKKSYSIPILG